MVQSPLKNEGELPFVLCIPEQLTYLGMFTSGAGRCPVCMKVK